MTTSKKLELQAQNQKIKTMDDKQLLIAINDNLDMAVRLSKLVQESVSFPIVDRITHDNVNLSELLEDTILEFKSNVDVRITEIQGMDKL